jgi:hypothetical protein
MGSSKHVTKPASDQNENQGIFCRVSIKKSFKRSIWQIKTRDHELFSLAQAFMFIEGMIEMRGWDPDDRTKIFHVIYGDAPFPGYQIHVKSGEDGFYHCLEPEGRAWKGRFPNQLFTHYDVIPEELYFRIEDGGPYTAALSVIEVERIPYPS